MKIAFSKQFFYVVNLGEKFCHCCFHLPPLLCQDQNDAEEKKRLCKGTPALKMAGVIAKEE